MLCRSLNSSPQESLHAFSLIYSRLVFVWSRVGVDGAVLSYCMLASMAQSVVIAPGRPGLYFLLRICSNRLSLLGVEALPRHLWATLFVPNWDDLFLPPMSCEFPRFSLDLSTSRKKVEAK